MRTFVNIVTVGGKGESKMIKKKECFNHFCPRLSEIVILKTGIVLDDRKC